MWFMKLMDLAVSLFWLGLFCLVVYKVIEALLGKAIRTPSESENKPRSRQEKVDGASLWMLLVSLGTAGCLALCYQMARGPGNNALPGFGGFLALVIGFPCVVVFLSTLKVWLDTLNSES